MKIVIEVAEVSTEVDLRDGTWTVGSGPSDAVRVKGLRPATLRMRLDGERLIVDAREDIRIDGLPMPTRFQRLLLPGEVAQLAPGIRLRRPEPAVDPQATRAAVCGLLGQGPASAELSCPTLTCLTGLDLGRRFAVGDGVHRIGRSGSAEVRIRDRAVSRVHARVSSGPRGYLLEDAGAPNGTFVNNEPLDGARLLRPGDLIELGRTLLKWHGPEPAPAPAELAPPPAPAGGERAGRFTMEWALLAAGAVAALVGALLTWGLGTSG